MYAEVFASRLKKGREKTGFSQKEIEKETGIPRTSIANYETGRTEPDIETLATLIDFYGIDPSWLLGLKKG